MNRLALAIHFLNVRQKDKEDFCLEPLEEEAIRVVSRLNQITDKDLASDIVDISGPINWFILPSSIFNYPI